MEVREGYKKTEVGVIPIDWDVKPLYELSKMKSGETITSASINESDIYPCYGGNGLRGYTNRFTQNGDYALIGRQGALCGNVQFVSGKFFASEHAVVVTPKTNTDIKWLYYMLGRINLNRYSESSAQPGLSVSKISILPIPSPTTIKEQIAITTALSNVGELISTLEKLITKKLNIKQGAMQQLLQPKEGWEMKTYGEIFDFLNTATYSRAELTTNNEVGYIHYGDIHTKWNCFLDIEKSNLPTVSDERVKNYNLLKDGDVIMADASEDYSGIGKCVEVKSLNDKKVISGLHTFLLRDNKEVLVNGFKGYLHTNMFIKNQFDKLATGMKVYGVSKSNLKTVIIPVPPKLEQVRISTILSDMDAEITTLVTKLEKYKLIKQGMMQNLLTGKIRLV